MMPGIKPGDLYKGTTTSVWHARSLLAAVGRVGKTSDGKSETVMGLSRGAWVRFPASAHPPKQEFFSFGPSAQSRISSCWKGRAVENGSEPGRSEKARKATDDAGN